MGQICTFFGHRDTGFTEKEKQALKEYITNLIVNKGVYEFWFGGYGDFDSLACSQVTELQKTYTNLIKCKVLAYHPTDPEDYKRTEKCYDYVFLPEEAEAGPTKFAICRRNNFMIDECDYLICYVKHKYGGAYTALKRAVSEKKIVYNVAESLK